MFPFTKKRVARERNFSTKQKCTFTAVTTFVFIIPLLVAYGLMPALGKISTEFGVTQDVLTIGNVSFYLIQCVSVFAVGDFGERFGRKPGILLCCACFCLSGVGLALSTSFAMYMVFRTMSAIGSAPLFAMGVAIQSDIWEPQHRSRAVGCCLAGTQVGCALGPVLGGAIMTFTEEWRNIFWLQCGVGGLGFICVLVFLQETKPQLSKISILTLLKAYSRRHIFLASLSMVLAMFVTESLVAPIAHIMKPRYNLKNELLAGLLYIPQGVGYFFGCLVGGWAADRELRAGKVAEDRLRSVLICSILTGPFFFMLYGWALDRRFGGLALSIIGQGCTGFSLAFYFPSIGAYFPDSSPDIGGSAIILNYSIRNIGSAAAAGTVLRSLDNIGVGWTSTIASLILFLSALPLVLLIWRESWQSGVVRGSGQQQDTKVISDESPSLDIEKHPEEKESMVYVTTKSR